MCVKLVGGANEIKLKGFARGLQSGNDRMAINSFAIIS